MVWYSLNHYMYVWPTFITGTCQQEQGFFDFGMSTIQNQLSETITINLKEAETLYVDLGYVPNVSRSSIHPIGMALVEASQESSVPRGWRQSWALQGPARLPSWTPSVAAPTTGLGPLGLGISAIRGGSKWLYKLYTSPLEFPLQNWERWGQENGAF